MTGNELLQGPATPNTSALPTTRDLYRKANAMNRTDEVKQRLGPIMERVKSSLARIHSLEQSLAWAKGDDEKSESVAVGRTIFVRGVEVESRQFLKRSMGMLKKKISTLQQMEESLSTSEDRREHLHHYILQVSLSRPMMELAFTKRRNRELELHLSAVEREFRRLHEEAETETANEYDDTASQNAQESVVLESYRSSTLSQKGRNALSSSKHQINGEGKGDLEVVMNVFRSTEDRGSYTKSIDSVRSSWTPVTDTDTDSSTVNSVSDTETSSESQDVNVSFSPSHRECDEYLSNPLDSSIDSSDAHEEHLDALHEAETGLIYQEVDENIHSPSVSHQNKGATLMVKLLARIKKLEQDNRELRELVSMQNKRTSEYNTTTPCDACDRQNGQ